MFSVKKIREELGFTQQELADKLGVPKERLSKWEQRNIVPKAEDYNNLLKLLAKDKSPLNQLNEDQAEYSSIKIEKYSTQSIGDIYERLIRQESITAVLKETVQNMLHQSTGKQVALISAELEEAISMTSKHKMDELKRKYG